MADEFKACSVDGCNRPAGRGSSRLNGYCYAHYSRWYKHGDTRPETPIAERFCIRKWFDKFEPATTDECIAWPFSRMKSGYPGGAMHRKVCEKAHGAPPTPHHQAAHSCGNGHLGCVNDRHLSWKTPQENTDDKSLHGTVSKGSKAYNACLNESQVAEIKNLISEGVGPTAISKMFNVSRFTIQFIKSGKTWKHV